MRDISFIKISRKLLKWRWFKRPEMVSLWIYLLLKANHEDGEWEGIKIKRGQLITSRKKLSEYTGISEQSVRTSLTKLKSTNEITIESTNSFTIITICNYNTYQEKKIITNQQTNQQINIPSTSDQPTPNHKQEEIKNEKNLIEDIFSRKEKFRNEVFSFDEYEEDHLEQFFNYWSEETHDKTKMNFELEKVWDTKLRLKRFKPIES
jgi:hypothetical protein